MSKFCGFLVPLGSGTPPKAVLFARAANPLAERSCQALGVSSARDAQDAAG